MVTVTVTVKNFGREILLKMKWHSPNIYRRLTLYWHLLILPTFTDCCILILVASWSVLHLDRRCILILIDSWFSLLLYCCCILIFIAYWSSLYLDPCCILTTAEKLKSLIHWKRLKGKIGRIWFTIRLLAKKKYIIVISGDVRNPESRGFAQSHNNCFFKKLKFLNARNIWTKSPTEVKRKGWLSI